MGGHRSDQDVRGLLLPSKFILGWYDRRGADCLNPTCLSSARNLALSSLSLLLG